ncbi:hypothetical protein EXIGLDRAFT_842887 [Exidia glandulosa HHB12029]|uniref:Uncharacterized protein n=1 Tax=Exidia glandulosa HHB12029 TaxID=1314781 RepID=A0A165CZS0_EXIGL|nr:hypothetical protein EXIGLDRAFT_842887 [Exidia glandulosa HHB12029]
MLLQLPPELLLRVTDFMLVGRFFTSGGKQALQAMSLTCRAVFPFARAKLLRRIYASSGARATAVITEMRLWNDTQRRVVRELHVDHLGPTSGKADQKVSHDVLADLLALLPYLEFLEARHFLGVWVSDRLASALSRLDLLRTVIISSGNAWAPASGVFAFLSSLSPRASFDVIRINVPGRPKSSKRSLPKISIKSPRVLCIQEAWFDTAPGSLSREAMWAGFAASCGTTMAYLDISISWLHEDLLRAIAPTIRALCIRSASGLDVLAGWDGDCFNERQFQSDISLPQLECLRLPLETARKIPYLRVPMFSNVRVLVVPRPRTPDPPSAHLDVVWDNIARAKFELVGIAAIYVHAVAGRTPVQVHMFPSRGVAALRDAGTAVMDCEDSAYPDLLALLERRVCVSTTGLW